MLEDQAEQSGERELIRRIMNGGRGLFYELVHPYERKIFAIAYTTLRKEADAEDAVQESALKALKNVTFSPPPHPNSCGHEQAQTRIGLGMELVMFGSRFIVLCSVLILAVALISCNANGRANIALPDPEVDSPIAQAGMKQEAVIAGGCFWGIQAVFQHVKGVKSAISGYAGGAADTAQYKLVSTGETGHAESVKITYDPSQITYGRLLRVFFSVAHDPTQLNRQGPDIGRQYRSAIFYRDAEQKRIAEAYIAQLTKAQAFPHPIVTQIVPLKAFYPAEAHHQDYAARHPNDPYITFNDAPKVAQLRQQFPDLYTAK